MNGSDHFFSGPLQAQLRVEGRLISVTAGSWSRHSQPHRGGSTVSGCSSRWRGFFLHLLAGLHVVCNYVRHSQPQRDSAKAFPASKGLWRLIPASKGTWRLLALINGLCDLNSFGYGGSSAQFFSEPLQAPLQSTVSGCSSRWQTFFLQLPVGMHRSAYSGVTHYMTVLHHSLWHFFAQKRNYNRKALPASKELSRPIPASKWTFSRYLLAIKGLWRAGTGFLRVIWCLSSKSHRMALTRNKVSWLLVHLAIISRDEMS